MRRPGPALTSVGAMARIAIVGGHGNVARQLHPLLLAAGHTPVALVRRAEQQEALEAQGVEVRRIDLEQADAAEYADAIAGADAVVFAAGGGPDGDIERKRTVDLEASLKSQTAAAAAGVRRFVQISAIGVDAPLGDDVEPVWRAYVEAKRDADAALRETDLDWTILRPGGLTDHPATDAVELGDTVERGEISRADVAAAVVAVLDEPRSVGHQWELVGGSHSIADAVQKALG